MATEKQVKDRVKRIIDLYTKYNAVYTLNPMTFGYGESGHPDKLVLINGSLIGIECKKDVNNHHIRPTLKAKPNEVMQKRQKQKIHDAGGYWVCICNVNFDLLIRMLDTCALRKSNTFTNDDKHLLEKLRQDI